MNPYYLYQHTDAALEERPYQRLDTRSRDIVDHALSVQQRINTVSAIEYLKARAISPAVIERVLLEPQKRRNEVAH